MFESLSSFESDGLRYRFITGTDKSFFISLYTSPEIMKYIRTPYSIAEAERIFEQFYNSNCNGQHEQFLWVVESDSGPLGFVGLFKIEGTWDLGAVISQESLGTGLGTRIMSKLMLKVFKCFPIEQVTGRILNNNKCAVRAVEKVGFQYLKDFEEGRIWVLKRGNFAYEQ